jgi:hypothetical protein
MRIAPFLLGLVILAVSSAPAAAVDLSKIDRTLAKEPAYQSKPKYCLLVFGPEAKHRVWIVLDGDTLYVDRNGNGDLTEAGERLKEQRPVPRQEFPAVSLSLPGEKDRQIHLQVTVHHVRFEGEEEEGPHPDVTVRIDGKEWRTYCEQFTNRPQEAPILHFDGALTFVLSNPQRTFVPGKTTNLVIYTGLPGLGKFTFSTRSARELVGAGAELTAEIEFPNKEPGGKPIRRWVTVPLDDLCDGNVFAGAVQVPEDAGFGTATMTVIRMPNLTPAVFRIPVEKSRGK